MLLYNINYNMAINKLFKPPLINRIFQLVMEDNFSHYLKFTNGP